MQFPAKKTLVAQKLHGISGLERVAFSSPVGLPVQKGDTGVRSRISRIDRLPDFLTHSLTHSALRKHH